MLALSPESHHHRPESAASIGIVVADGQALIRAAFHALLDRHQDLAVLGQAGNTVETIAVTRRVRPDVLLVDSGLPGLDAVRLTRELAADRETADVRIVVLTASGDADLVLDALRAGVSGILLANTGPTELVNAVRAVASGNGVLSPSVTRRLMDEFAALPAGDRVNADQLDELTPRELEVVALVASGMSNQDIAEHLVVTRATAKTHVSRALSKLDARDRAQLVALAYETGLVVPQTRGGGGPILAAA